MVSTRVALVSLVLAAAGCAKRSKEASQSSSPSGGAAETKAEPPPPANPPPTNPPPANPPPTNPPPTNPPPTNPPPTNPPPTSPPVDQGSARDQARAQGMVGPADERLGSDIKSGFDDDKKPPATQKPPAEAQQRIRGGKGEGGSAAKHTGTRIDIATLQGNPNAVLESQVESRLADLQACYDKARATKADLAGRMDLSFSVKGDGTLVAPMLAPTSTIKDRAFGTCVIGIVAKLQLEPVSTPPIKGVVVIAFGS